MNNARLYFARKLPSDRDTIILMLGSSVGKTTVLPVVKEFFEWEARGRDWEKTIKRRLKKKGG